ncbi:MAG TPA: hypothetical protein VFE31_01930 [Opitutaceae bacterium]|jgi:hypothetical protein|nr:hypothetical protein [Opitutaceae bacterium]
MVLAVFVAGGAAPLRAREWRVLRNPQFTLYSDATDGTMHDVATDLRDALDVLAKVLVVDPAARQPLTVVLFDWQSELDPYLPEVAPGKSIDDVSQEEFTWTPAFSCAGPDWFVIAAAAQDYERGTRRGITESAVGWYLNTWDYPLPLAVSTGLTRTLGTFRRQSTHGDLGQAPRGLREILTHWQLIPVRQLLGLRNMSTIIQAQERVTFTAESWGLVHFLMFAPEPSRRHAMAQFLAAFRKHETPDQALVAALGPEGAARIDVSLNAYLQSAFEVVRLPLPPDVEDSEPIAAAPRLELEVALAKSAMAGRATAAPSHIAAALAAAPTQPAGYEIEAQYAADEGKPDDDVRALVDEAIAHGSRDSWVLWKSAGYHLADAGDGAAPPAQVRAAIRLAERAANADHNFRPAFDFIALHLWQCPPIPSDGAFLAFARARYPSDRWILVGQAAIARAHGDPNGAAQLLAQAQSSDPVLSPSQLPGVLAFARLRQ